MSAEERREIGILKAIGWETADVLQMKFWEGMTVSLTAFFLGIILAYVHIFLAAARCFPPVLKGWSVLYPEFQTDPVHQRLSNRISVLSYGGALYRGHHHPLLAGGHH